MVKFVKITITFNVKRLGSSSSLKIFTSVKFISTFSEKFTIKPKFLAIGKKLIFFDLTAILLYNYKRDLTVTPNREPNGTRQSINKKSVTK